MRVVLVRSAVVSIRRSGVVGVHVRSIIAFLRSSSLTCGGEIVFEAQVSGFHFTYQKVKHSARLIFFRHDND